MPVVREEEEEISMVLPGGGGPRNSAEPLFYTIWLALDSPHVLHVLPSEQKRHAGEEAGASGAEASGGGTQQQQAVAVSIRPGEVLVMASSTRYCHR